MPGNGQQYPNNPDRVREDMGDYLAVVCTQPVREEVVDGVRKAVICGGGVWIVEQLVLCGVHRFKKGDRRFDRQFPSGVTFRCMACGSIQEKRDIEAIP